MKIGLAGICVTDHETLSNAMELNRWRVKLHSENNPFKVIQGNEIYLVDERAPGQKYYHFILLAKNYTGQVMLNELSSTAWINSYFDRGLERVPTLKEELKSVINKYGKGNLIGSTACLGGELDTCILEMTKAETIGDKTSKRKYYNQICDFLNFCLDLFGEDFYLELQPAKSKEQIIVNNRMPAIAKAFGIKMVVSTDAHYLREKDRYVHKAYLNAKEGDREVDAFYAYCYLQTDEEAIKNLENSNVDYNELAENTLEIYNKIEFYDLSKNQSVPQVSVPSYKKNDCFDKEFKIKYPTLTYLFNSDNIQERYWVNQCWEKMEQLNILNNEYIERLEYEADIKKHIGDNLNTCVFAYPVFLQHYINMFWDCGSPVGAGRGSAGAGLNHYLLGITQVDPIKAGLPFWRYMNKDRKELPDIDLDLAPSRREAIFQEIRKERGKLGCVQVCTFSTETTKSAIQTACRGYRSEEYPNGIDNDTAQYLSSLVPVERGFLWSINDVVYGNEDKGRKPNKTFVNYIKKYDGLLDIIINIEGLIKNRSIHASGVVFFNDEPFREASFMKATNGSIITQLSLHDLEATGLTKYDFLVTEQMDIMAQCIQLLQEHGYFEKELTLRQAYDKYVHPDKIPLEDDKLWDAINKANILALFQLNTAVGGNIVRQLQPRNVDELTACNGLMRLMGEEGQERPADRYARLKKDISAWYREMDLAGLSKSEQKTMEKYCLADHGAPSSQEVLMTILMDEDTCGFTLAEANAARKLVAKKKINEIPAFKEKVLNRAKTEALGHYIWHSVIGPQLGYSFSRIHGYTYSLIGCQAAYLATYYPSIYWNTAYLRVISGLEADASSNYDKIAKGVGDIYSNGVDISLIDINKSGYMFEPDEETGSILYGMKALNGVGGEVIEQIIENRPYSGLVDFIEKNGCNKTVMISLIKSGAFDQFGKRADIMKEYIWSVCEPKKRITMQNFNMLKEKDMVPDSLDFEKRVFNFNKAIKKFCKVPGGYKLDGRYYEFYNEHFDIDNLVPQSDYLLLPEKSWKKSYDAALVPAKTWLNANKQELLDKLNYVLFQETWNKYAEGSYSAWEMAALGFYHHDHELANIDEHTYGIVEFNSLPEDPIVEYEFKRGDRAIPIFETTRICGTVIAKDDTKSSISILTKNSGVVNVKFTLDYYAKYNQRISELGSDGVKHVMEPGWFSRGTLVVINGFRRGNTFVAKKYKKTSSHQLYKITSLLDNGLIKMTNLRYGEEEAA